MGRPTIAEIDLEALRHNLGELRALAGKRAEVLGIVKADAYGHGAVEVARELESAGTGIFAAATAEEGAELRRSGIASPILILAGIYPEDFPLALENRLTPVIFDLQVARALSAHGERLKRRISVHVKIDTGLNRLGIAWRDWEPALGELESLKGLEVEGLMSHLSVAESGQPEDRDFTAEQMSRFARCLDLARRRGNRPRYLHLANSAATALHETARFNLVRPGLMLYGVHPDSALKGLVSLRPVLHWKTAVLSVKQVPAGDPVSYGRTHRCRGDSRIAVLPVGYADGYSRRLSNRGEVLIRGRRAKVAGIVCMDLTMADVTEIPGVQPGDEVVLLGRQEEEEISAADLARWTGSIPYEVLCAIGRRVPRVYRGQTPEKPPRRGNEKDPR